ncbi:MAG: hypothetical protein HYX79_10950 [Chloroflexi bacterium]|nr:hypothetical protein [Chloroflexota bacterium]
MFYDFHFKEIVDKYKLDLNGAWSKVEIPQNGRHPDVYHKWVNEQLKIIDKQANGDPEKFLKLFDENIKTPLQNNPEMIFKEFWESGAQAIPEPEIPQWEDWEW